MSLFDNIIIKKIKTISKSGLDVFTIYINIWYHQVEKLSLILTQLFGMFPQFK